MTVMTQRRRKSNYPDAKTRATLSAFRNKCTTQQDFLDLTGFNHVTWGRIISQLAVSADTLEKAEELANKIRSGELQPI